MNRKILSIVSLTLTLGLGLACDSGGDSKDKTADAGKADGAKAKGSSAQGAADAGPRGDAKAGEAIYKTKCLMCHQADGKGMNGMMGGNFVDEKERLAKPDSELLKVIAEGVQGKTSMMPPQKDLLSEQERKDALAYIRETFGDK